MHNSYSVFARKKAVHGSFSTEMKALANFSTINQFWSMYQHLKRPNSFDKETVLNVFVKGIKPIWEDPEHV